MSICMITHEPCSLCASVALQSTASWRSVCRRLLVWWDLASDGWLSLVLPLLVLLWIWLVLLSQERLPGLLVAVGPDPHDTRGDCEEDGHGDEGCHHGHGDDLCGGKCLSCGKVPHTHCVRLNSSMLRGISQILSTLGYLIKHNKIQRKPTIILCVCRLHRLQLPYFLSYPPWKNIFLNPFSNSFLYSKIPL